MRRMKLLIEHCDVLRPGALRNTLPDQSILVDGARIRLIDSPAEVERQITPALRAEMTVIDGHHLLAMPGLISAHTHSPENFLRGATERMPLEPWLVWLYGSCGQQTARDHYLCAAMSAIEMLLSGCTGTLDHLWHGGPWKVEYLEGAMQAYRDSGMRATVAPLYDDHDYVLDAADALGHNLRTSVYGVAHGGSDAQRAALLRDNLDLFDDWMTDWHGEADGRLQTFLGPAAGQLVTAECLHMSLDLARKHGAGMHMHCVETRVQDYCIRRAHEGRTAIHWMHDEGLLGSDVSLPHSVWIRSADDLGRLADSGAIPVHNPAANLKLGSGLMALREMLDQGITVALGVDGACSNDNQNLLESVKLAALIHNLKDPDPRTWISAREAVGLATHGGAAALLMRNELGDLQPGYRADIVLLDQHRPVVSPWNDAYGMLAYCELGQSVRHVIVNGEVVVRDGKLLTLDVDAIAQEFRERVDHFPFRHPLDAKTQQDVADCTAFWQDVMQRVQRGE
jgi:cytosine/adenosine deaminase-related metal-dependent hydrolase